MPRKKQQRADWGSVTEIDKGKRYRLRYWAKDDSGIYRRCSTTVRGTRRDAYDKLAALRLDHSEEAPCPTVGECYERWYLPGKIMQVEGGDLAPVSVTQYKSMWRRHIAPIWADITVDEVHALAVQQWIDELPHNAAIVSIPIFRQILDYAVRYELIDSNPLKIRYRIPSPSTSETRDSGIWSLDELCVIADAIKGEWFEAAYLLGAFGGCRVGESLGIRREDVKLCKYHDVVIAVCKLHAQVTNSNEFSESLKNKWSYRSVVVPGSYGERLYDIAQTCGGGWLTGNGLGSYARQDTLRRAWERWWAHELPTFHTMQRLRPSWQTYMRWTLGVPPYLIERMMGHVGEGVTGAHYDKPESEQFCYALASAFAQHPF